MEILPPPQTHIKTISRIQKHKEEMHIKNKIQQKTAFNSFLSKQIKLCWKRGAQTRQINMPKE